MLSELDARVERWDRTAPTGTPFADLLRLVRYIADRRYYQYIPTVGPYPDFHERLSRWVTQVDRPSYQKALLQFVPHLLFVGQEDFALLYRSAYLGPITRWICNLAKIDLESPNAGGQLAAELATHTWYCPITDSMNISAFYHANRIQGIGYRPDWRSIAKFGDPGKTAEYMQAKTLRRLVLLEDFVGTGTQMTRAVTFAAQHLTNVPVLVCPLIVAPKGSQRGKDLASQHNTVTFDPVFALASHHGALTIDSEAVNRAHWHKALRVIGRLAPRLSSRVFSTGLPDDWGPWGYKNTGTIVVLHSNTPNNSLPILHHDVSAHWSALFPRSTRV